MTTTRRLKLLLVDFDGVLSNGRFYQLPDSSQREIGETAAGIIFSQASEVIVRQWMKGELTYGQVHDYVEQQAGIDARLLDALLEESVKHMPLNPSLLRFISLLRSQDVSVSLFTDNMDIFDSVSRNYHALDRHFDHIYSSSAFGQLKLENDRLLIRAASDVGTAFRNIALVDDSPNSFTRATGYGVDTFLYSQYEDSQPAFEQWLKRSYTWN